MTMPEIVCLCGSTRFIEECNYWRKKFTLQGKIVLAVEIVTTQLVSEDPQHVAPDVKAMLDELHLRKIDMSDWVMILDVGGYMGESTKNELAYARRQGKPVQFLSEMV